MPPLLGAPEAPHEEQSKAAAESFSLVPYCCQKEVVAENFFSVRGSQVIKGGGSIRGGGWYYLFKFIIVIICPSANSFHLLDLGFLENASKVDHI